MVRKKKAVKSIKPKYKTSVDGLKSVLKAKPVMSLPRYKCKKCGHEWIPRTNEPMVCPRCHRAFAG
jgi:rubrerythrin